MADGSGTASAIGLPTLACLTVSSAVLAACTTYALLSLNNKSCQHEQEGAKQQQLGEECKAAQQQQQQAASGQQVPTLEMTALKAHLPAMEARRMDPYDPSPRTGYLQWDDYFMALAFLSAQRSKDPNKQVGAVIVGGNKVILSIGYNGFPRGCPDSALPWAKLPPQGTKDPLATKYPYVVHAEANALLNKNTASTSGASIYVTMFPCNECAKLLIQAGITEVIYHEDKVQEKVAGEAPGVTGEAQLGTAPPSSSSAAEKGGENSGRSTQPSSNGLQPGPTSQLSSSGPGPDGYATGSGRPHMNGVSSAAQTNGPQGIVESSQTGKVSEDQASSKEWPCSIHLSSCCCSQDCSSPGPLSHTISSNGCASANCSSSGAASGPAAEHTNTCVQGSAGDRTGCLNLAAQGGSNGVIGAKRDLTKESALDDACYMASKRLLQMAGVRLRQHKLQRLVVLGPRPDL